MAVTEPVFPGFTEASFTHDGTSRRIFRPAGRRDPRGARHHSPGRDEPGHPTRAALDQVLDFLQERLRPG
jgi:hypothetical protein